MSTIKVSNLQNASAASPAIVLDANSRATLNGLSYPTEGSLSGRNRVINGDMRIDQRNAGASVTPSAGSFIYTVDRWWYYALQSSKFTVQRNAGSVTPPSGFTNYLGLTVASAVTPGATDQFIFGQSIEGFNFSDVGFGTAAAKSISISFWVRSSLTGQFSVALQNDSGTRTYAATYTITVANTWQYVTVTVPGVTSGTWDTGNGLATYVIFDLGVGSNQQITPNTWVNGSANAASGNVKLVQTAGATFYITGVQLEAGSVATPFERRSYGQELALCQRYGLRVEQQQNSGGVSSTASLLNVRYQFPVTMRSTPTASFITSGSWIVGNDYSANYTASSATIGTTNLTPNGGRIAITGFPTFAGNYFLAGTDAVGTAVLFLSAEL